MNYLALGLVLAALALFAAAAIRRGPAALPGSPIARIRPGARVRVRGRVTRMVAVRLSPFHEVPCALWQVRVRRHGDIASALVTEGSLFVIEDGGGRVFVDPREHAEVELLGTLDTFEVEEEEALAFLRTHAPDLADIPAEELHFAEGGISVDDVVEVWGVAEREARPGDEDALYRDAEVLVLRGSREAPLVVRELGTVTPEASGPPPPEA